MNPYSVTNTGILKSKLSISKQISDLLEKIANLDNWEGPYRTQWSPKKHCRDEALDILKDLYLINLDVIP